MKKKPDICVSVGGYDCTGTEKWSAADFRKLSAVFAEAAAAVENKTHGCLEEKGLVHVCIDFGGPFDDDKGLPPIPRVK